MQFEEFELLPVSTPKSTISRPLIELHGPRTSEYYYIPPQPLAFQGKRKSSTKRNPNLLSRQASSTSFGEFNAVTPRAAVTPKTGNPNRMNSYNYSAENHQFKPMIFLEFFFYFVIKSLFGPFSIFFFRRFVTNGIVLTNNLEVNEVRIKNFVWLIKFYCSITTFVFRNQTIQEAISGVRTGYEYNSTSQFWLLIHTEISLSVLYAAYYASLTDSEINLLRTEDCRDGNGIFDRVLNLVRLGKAKLYEITNLARSFPEIDIDNFFFVYPKETKGQIPEELQPEDLKQRAKQLNKIGIQEGVIIPCDKYATHIAEFSGYQKLEFRVKMIRYFSRGLVFVNSILPVINNIYQILADGKEIEHIFAFATYVTQQIFYSYLLYRLAAVYDVLFLGLLLYYKKFQLLSWLGEVIRVRPDSYYLGLLYIPTTVPQNIENWLSLRKVLASINSQAFVVIDLNMSFVLLYTLVFIAFYTMISLKVEASTPLEEFLKENQGIQATLTLTIVVVLIVLIIDVALGILINRLFMFEKHEWIIHETVITNMKVSHEIYRDLSVEDSRSDVYARKMHEIQSLMGSNLKDYLYVYTKRLRDSIIMVIKAIDHMEFFNPHTLLGIKTDIRLVVALGTAISAIGVSTIVNIIKNVVNSIPDIPGL